MSERERRDGEGLLPSLGRYRLIRRLALGGMAEIYLARAEGAEGFAKPVVIKRILPDHAHDPENVALFVEEARLAARLNHANITQIFDFEEDERGGSYYMAMEYVHGQDLRALLDRCRLLDRRLGVARAVQICAEVLEGLSYAHEYTRRGRPLEIVHRDISPRNILVGFNGDVKLADFGIARARGGLEERGVVRGKVAYMSPEQIQDLPLDRRSDLYSLGLVLYEMLTGVRALEGPDGRPSTALTARAEFPPAEALCPELPGPLCAILRRALRRAPDERFADGRELLRELKGFLFGTVSSPAEIELREFMNSIFPEVTDLSVTVSSARALLIQRESSGLQLTEALRQALAARGVPAPPLPAAAARPALALAAPPSGQGATSSPPAEPGRLATAEPDTRPTRPDRPQPAPPGAAHGGVQAAAEELIATQVDGGPGPPGAGRAAPEPAAGGQPFPPPSPAEEDGGQAPPTLIDGELLATLLQPMAGVAAAAAAAAARATPTGAGATAPTPLQRTTVPDVPAVGGPGLDGWGMLPAAAPPRRAWSAAAAAVALLLLAGLGLLWWAAPTGAPAPASPQPVTAVPAGARPGGALPVPPAGSGRAEQGQSEQGGAEPDGAAGTSAGPSRDEAAAAGAAAQPPRSEGAAAGVSPASAGEAGARAGGQGSDSTARARPTRKPAPDRQARGGRPTAAEGPARVAAGEAVSSDQAASCRLLINAEDYAEVWVDGQGPRETPAEWQLRPGRHQLRLVNRAEGVVKQETIELSPGQRLQRTYKMKR